jgi:CheY-like chemotaxis protein/phosphoribosyl 1,2-cyclic phosphodiesterase
MPAGSTSRSYRFFVVDDDPIAAAAAAAILTKAGHQVEVVGSAADALSRIPAARPDCVLLDLMMPDTDGFEVCRALRAHADLAATKILVLSSKAYDYDQRRARSVGADGYLTKPVRPNELLRTALRLIEDVMEVAYWGVRGTLPVPGPRTARYGGNTCCVTLSLPSEALFVFDAGTGLKALSDSIVAQGRSRISGHLFISHPHWDHINALPFFAPLYVPGNAFEILGAPQGETDVRKMVSDQMDGVYFPVTIREFGARLSFRDLTEGTYQIEGATVRTKLLTHPGQCLGYRVEYCGRAFCYVTDNELYPEGHPQFNPQYREQLEEFVHGADLLVTDACYTDDEYKRKHGWGHSNVSEATKFAAQAQVKALHLYHHDPDQTDVDIDAKLLHAQTLLTQLGSQTIVTAPAEGQTFYI